MVNSDWDDILSGISNEEFNRVLILLEEKGYITDEDDTFISKLMISKGIKNLIEALIRNGYRGGELITTGKICGNGHLITVIFDSSLWENQQILAMIKASD